MHGMQQESQADKTEYVENKQKERESNIELLRIILMILITLHHYALFTNGLVYISRFTQIVTVYGGKIAVVVFIIISGFFLGASKFSSRKLLKLWFEVLCYSLIPTIIYNIIQGNNPSFDNLYKYFYPISSNIYWFITSYIQLYLLSPFLIKMINSIKKDTLKKFLIVITILFIGMKAVLYKNQILDFSNVFGFIYFFCIGAYIKLYGISFFEKSKKRNILLLLGVLIIYFFMRAILVKIIEPMKIAQLGYVIDANLLNYNINGVFTLVVSILLFYVMKNIKLKTNKIINFISSASFAVYLLQEQPLLRNIIWKGIFDTQFIYVNNLSELWKDYNLLNCIAATPTVAIGNLLGISNQHLLIIHAIISAIIIYIMAILIEIVRKNIIETPLFKIVGKSKKINKILDKIDIWMNE